MKLLPILTLVTIMSTCTSFTTPKRALVLSKTLNPTQLNLFGGKKSPSSDGGGGSGGPGMMDQLAMFKKAQEIAQKKSELDKELQAMDIRGTAADGKVTVIVNYVPAQMPMNPLPGFETKKVDIDEEYLEMVSCEDLERALVDAIREGEAEATKAMQEKYQSLNEDLSGMLGGGPPK